MDFRHSERSAEYQRKVETFLTEHVYPTEHTFEEQAAANRAAGTPFRTPAVLQELKAEARRRGLWNLFLPDAEDGAGLTVLDYAPAGGAVRSLPRDRSRGDELLGADTGNMELLHMFATDEQRKALARAAPRGRIRSCFSMTEPDVASSDATNIATTAHIARRRLSSSTVASGGRPARCAPMRDLDRDGRDRPRCRSACRSTRWCSSRSTPPA